MIRRPRLRPDLHIVVAPPDRVYLLAETRQFTLTGRAQVAVVPLIDGVRTSDAIVDALAGELSPTEAFLALLTLEKHGHLEESQGPDVVEAPIGRDAEAFWASLGVPIRQASERLSVARVAVMGVGGALTESMRCGLERTGIRVVEERSAAELLVVMTDDALRPELEVINRESLDSDRPWLLVRPNGLLPWVGPLFRPGDSGCWRCLTQRLEANREVDVFVASLPGGRDAAPFPARGLLPAVAEAVTGLATLEVARWIVQGASSLVGRVVTLHTTTLQTQEHCLIRRPQCPACGDPSIISERTPRIELQPRPKVHTTDGGHRAASPQQMLARFEQHVSPITGVTRALVRITDPADPIQHVYLAGSNLAVRHDSLQRLRRHLRSACCGKGTTDAQARASALGEAIERYSGVFRGDEPRIRGSLRSLRDRAIDPRTSMLFSDAQYRDRDRWNALDRRLDAVPLPFDEDAGIEWSPLWSLTLGEARYLPTSYCYYSHPTRPEHAFCQPDSNGSAAGSTLEDAILQGFLELVERDGVAIHWYNRIRRPGVDLDRVDDPFVQGMQTLHRGLGRELWALDLTTDLGIPVMLALSRRVQGHPDSGGEEIVFAPAAHLDPLICLQRALTEINQMMPGLAAAPDGGQYTYDDPEAVQWWRTATLANQPYLAPSDQPPIDPASHGRSWSDDLRTDIQTCQSIVESKGLELLVLDQTRPDIGMPVVKVVVPGLRHFWARYAPGRLYDVPVASGWLERPTPEDALNPITMFI